MKNIVIISHSLIPSVLLCGHSQLDYLQKEGKINYRFIKARKVRSSDVNWADIIVFVRSESHLEAYVSKLAKGKKHLVYVLDDDLLNIPDYASSARYYNIPSIHNNILSIIQNCDTFLTPSPILLKKYGNYCKNSYLIDEPSLGSINKKENNEKIKIGFAGSIDRTKDINDILTDGLEYIINKYQNEVSVEFMGAKPQLVDKYKLEYHPYQRSYKKYTEAIGQANWDIGLAPMPISEFHKCKYFNKYVEYASYGIVGIYTNTEPYTFGIKDKENGLLVNNTKEEWISAIEELISNEVLRKKLQSNILKEANEKYSLNTLSKQYYERIVINSDDKNNEDIDITLSIKLQIFVSMVKDKMFVQGWRFPFWCVKFICVKILEKLHLYEPNKEDE